jgi:mannosyltransferase OCH1-like enzyme
MLEPVLAARLLPVVPLATLEAEQMASEEMSEAPAIPRRIIQFWDAQTPPDEVAQLVARTKAANPDCTHQLFSDEAAREFLRGALGSDSLALYEACPHVAAKADFFRVAYLLEHGGIYIDADEVSVRPLTNFFNRRNYDLVLRFTEAETSCINNGFIATKPKSPVLERVLNSILGNLENVRKFQAQTNVWVLTGPGIWSFSIIDLALDPLASYHGSPFAQACFIDDQSYNALLHSPVMEYKNDPKGNWRMV